MEVGLIMASKQTVPPAVSRFFRGVSRATRVGCLDVLFGRFSLLSDLLMHH